jgi:hypothetical protein
VAGAAAVAVTGSAAISEAPDIVAGTGSSLSPITGAAAITEAADRINATATAPVVAPTPASAYPPLQTGASLRSIVEQFNRLLQGKMNAVATVTLAPGTTTTITDSRIGPASFISVSPTNAAAAGLFSGVHIASKTKGSATLGHGTAAGTETYDVLIIG